MPNSRKSRPARISALPSRASDLRHSNLEARREALLIRLQNLDEVAKNSRGYRSTLILLNQKYRKASLTARLGILQAAAFMIEVLELLPLA
jgi:hypothetical protein